MNFKTQTSTDYHNVNIYKVLLKDNIAFPLHSTESVAFELIEILVVAYIVLSA